jgi:DNA invertase Pin-like site-specific DNA recombinase
VSGAVIYCRISQDRAGEAAGVTRQREDATALAKVRDWQVFDIIVDNDVSAAGRKPRPGFERLLRSVQDGTVQVVIAWALDRLTRNRRDTVRLIEACQAHGVTIALVRGSDMDMSTPAGRMLADILAAVARSEIETKSDRQKRATLQAAQQGKRVSGGRPFGYEPDGMTVREAEAQAVRQAYRWVIDGMGLAEIARRWNAAGLFTPYGGPWQGTTVSANLRRPRYAGYRAHHARNAKRDPHDDHIVADAAWPALVDRETWHTAQAVMRDPSRLKPHGNQRLLTSVALCGVCGGLIHAGGQKGNSAYRCRESTGHFCRKSEPIDDLVSEVMIARLSSPDAAVLWNRPAKGPSTAELVRTADEIRRKLDGLADAYARGVLPMAAVEKSSANLRAELERTEAHLVEAQGLPKALRGVVNAADVRAAWESLEVADRREIIRALVEIHIDPPGRGARVFDPETVRISWR